MKVLILIIELTQDIHNIPHPNMFRQDIILRYVLQTTEIRNIFKSEQFSCQRIKFEHTFSIHSLSSKVHNFFIPTIV